jgi:hypothetical protein
VDVQEVPTVVLEFSSRLFGLYGVWHFHDKAVLILPVGLDVSCELHPDTSTELLQYLYDAEFTFSPPF